MKIRRPIVPRRYCSTIPRRPRYSSPIPPTNTSPKHAMDNSFYWEKNSRALIAAYIIAVLLLLLVLSPIL